VTERDTSRPASSVATGLENDPLLDVDAAEAEDRARPSHRRQAFGMLLCFIGTGSSCLVPTVYERAAKTGDPGASPMEVMLYAMWPFFLALLVVGVTRVERDLSKTGASFFRPAMFVQVLSIVPALVVGLGMFRTNDRLLAAGLLAAGALLYILTFITKRLAFFVAAWVAFAVLQPLSYIHERNQDALMEEPSTSSESAGQ